jgi:cytidine diphosphoramidate kinase
VVIWLVGLSASGKTSIARRIVELWRQTAPNTVLVDGDDVRRVFADGAGGGDYTLEGRRRNNARTAAICRWLDEQRQNVVCAILNVVPERLAENRHDFTSYFEVFVDTPLAVCERRDARGLYARARAGQEQHVVGFDIPFPVPPRPDMVIDNSVDAADLARVARTVLEAAGQAAIG